MELIKVGIAEDHKALREALLQNFKRYKNFEVLIVAENGKDLLDRLLETMIDVVLLDINMPMMNGYETMVKLKNHYPEIKVIIYSSNSEQVVMNHFKSLGAHHFLPKNTDFVKIVDTIQKIIEENT